MTDARQEPTDQPQGKELCGRPSESGTCKNRAGYGTPHFGRGPCKRHGGSMPTVVKHYAVEIAQEECDNFGIPVEIEPHESLLNALYEAEGHATWLRMKVEDEDQGVIEIVTTRGENWARTERRPSIYKELWDRERDRAARLANACIKAGIAERQVKIAEQQADMLVGVIRAVLNDPTLALTPAQQAAANEAVPKHLRAVG